MASFYNNYYRYYRPPYLHTNFPKQLTETPISKEKNEKEEKESQEYDETKNEKRKTSRYNSFGPLNFKNPFFNDIEEPIFEILGIELYLDDIIILGLLFFLYQEGVQDEMLYIALILILIS